jgi:hypothetical protein
MYLDRDMLWRVAPGGVDVMIGSAADHIVLRDSVEVNAGNRAVTGVSKQPDLSR